LLTLNKYEIDILETLRWIDEDLSDWAKKINYYPLVYNRVLIIDKDLQIIE